MLPRAGGRWEGAGHNHSICYKDVYARGWDDYLAKTFFAAPEDRLWGAASTEYLAGAPFAANGSRADAAESERIVPRRPHH